MVSELIDEIQEMFPETEWEDEVGCLVWPVEYGDDEIEIAVSLLEGVPDEALDLFGEDVEVEVEDFPLRVEFYAELPEEVDDLAADQVSSLLHSINRLVEMPGFALDEEEGVIQFRYMHFSPPGTLDVPLLGTIVGIIQMQLELFRGPIQATLQGDENLQNSVDLILSHIKPEE